MITLVIYKITNKINGKMYIGLTTQDLEMRMKGHRTEAKLKPNIKFYRAINKYGFENFECEIVDDTAHDLEELAELEIKYIKKYDTYNNGYNSTHGGEISPMCYPEVRKKSSKSLTGRKFSKEHKQNLSLAFQGRKGNPHTKEHKEYMSKIMKGREVSDKTKEKLRQINLGKTQSKETIEKRMKHIRGIPKSKEHAAKLGEILRNAKRNTGLKHFKSKAVCQLNKDTNEVLRVFETVSGADEYVSGTRQNGSVSRCISGKRKTAYGYKWREATEEEAKTLMVLEDNQ